MRSLLQGMADLVFPPRCLACRSVLRIPQSLLFCPDCTARIKTITSPMCTVCGLPFLSPEVTNHLCGECVLSPKAFSIARALGHYETTLLDAIHAFKYRGKTALGRQLGRAMAEHEYPGLAVSTYSTIIPVPLHVRRLRERTFNQALILARAISRRYAIPLDFTSLKRHRYTKPQIALGKTERQINVRGAFRVADPDRIKGKSIILVDDVYTTGNTLNECARVLMESGAADVAVLTLARVA